jgi:predicted CoA-binding protein
MASSYETFWENQSFAVVGHSDKKPFPKLTYKGLKKLGKSVFPVDPSSADIDGDETYPDLDALPNKVDAVVLEPPKEETRDWVQKVVDAGVKNLWIHMETDTPEAVQLAQDNGIDVRTGTCGVMYVTQGFTYHSIHKFIMKLLGKF